MGYVFRDDELLVENFKLFIMKKQNLKSLKLNKKSISSLTRLFGGADAHGNGNAAPAKTCEGPCKGGTGCCNGTGTVGPACTFDPESVSWIIGVCDCIL